MNDAEQVEYLRDALTMAFNEMAGGWINGVPGSVERLDKLMEICGKVGLRVPEMDERMHVLLDEIGIEKLNPPKWERVERLETTLKAVATMLEKSMPAVPHYWPDSALRRTVLVETGMWTDPLAHLKQDTSLEQASERMSRKQLAEWAARHDCGTHQAMGLRRNDRVTVDGYHTLQEVGALRLAGKWQT